MSLQLRIEEKVAELREKFTEDELAEAFSRRTLEEEFFELGKLLNPSRWDKMKPFLVVRAGYEEVANITPILRKE